MKLRLHSVAFHQKHFTPETFYASANSGSENNLAMHPGLSLNKLHIIFAKGSVHSSVQTSHRSLCCQFGSKQPVSNMVR